MSNSKYAAVFLTAINQDAISSRDKQIEKISIDINLFSHGSNNLNLIVRNKSEKLDVKNAKPDPEGYILCCEKLELKPEQVLVVEDGSYGIEAAKRAGCNILKVDSPKDVSLELFSELVPKLVGLEK
jgi:HAD superfamily hydrolase (TIGR01509 family)